MNRSPGLRSKVVASLRDAIGDIAFGFADGAISVAGLVFGVAAGTSDGSIVVLAGTTGAAAAAVSMMAGRYLDIQSVAQEEGATLAAVEQRVRANPEPYLANAAGRLRSSGIGDEAAAIVVDSFRRHPDALVDHVMAYEVGIHQKSGTTPWTHALWMFFAVLFAACIPVIPFALLDIDAARVVSLIITGILMAALGIIRGRLGGVNVWWSAAQTVAVAGAAALVGVLIGSLVAG